MSQHSNTYQSDLLHPVICQSYSLTKTDNSFTLYPQTGFLQTFIQAISIVPLQAHYYSEALPTPHGYCAGVSRLSATGNCKRRTCPRWRLERDLNLQPFGRKAPNLPMSHHSQQDNPY